jgi:regulator of cell morphogenesis and NO signaling
MTTFQVEQTVGSIVASRPALSRVFEKAGVDYCCGGKKTLAQACQEKGLDAQSLLEKLEACTAATDDSLVDAASMSLTELADHIEKTHHAYLQSELPRLIWLTQKVASAHGSKDPRLNDVSEILFVLARELSSHMMKEEQILFPLVRRLEMSDSPVAFHCGSITNPIRQMEFEHQDAGEALAKLRALTDDYTPPDWACNTYRATLDALAQFERDMHQHVHKEDNVLFPRAIKREESLSQVPHNSLKELAG